MHPSVDHYPGLTKAVLLVITEPPLSWKSATVYRDILALLDKLDQSFNLIPVEFHVVNEFRKIKVFSCGERLPWLIVHWSNSVRATLPSALNVMNASPVGKVVQLVTASRLILYHEGQIDPMKDECHYQVKH